MKRAIREHAGDFGAIIGLLVIALGVSYVILQNQRLRIPLLEAKPFQIEGVFQTGQAITPGQGQTVRVSGVRVGDISRVRLEGGQAIITMDLDEDYEGLVRKNWTGLLRPKTGLKDMFIELTPGRGEAPPAEAGWQMPIANTLPDVNPDEFLSALDADTRDYLKLLLNGAKGGLEGNAHDLSQVLRRFEPTYRDLAAVSGEVAKRRADLRRLVHALDDLNTELGNADDDLAELVGASARTFEAFAQEHDNVAGTVRELPATLRVTTDALGKVERMARVLGPAADRIRRPVRALRRANAATLPFAREAVPLLRNDIRPFVREARPFLRALRPAASDLVEADPDLKATVRALNGLFNLLAFNTGGREGPEVAARDEGYLFYLAWLAHTSIQLFSGQDAHGVFRPLMFGGTCNTI
ncbi:MAG: phospholipid/cholesterol/gamma-HCH transport system substrate-binding protein, partial [Solirubrobacteraceae bacterium]|nr:phospholipid/cholesterol/gamma-HCH transport system substrate-binding protein [Solirubrobacteraceae bacterium]